MGTNYYWKDKGESKFDGHIGKMSAAGPYCWECGATLCTWGTEHVHSGGGSIAEDCPVCEKSRGELDSTCSFTWTYMAQYEKLKTMKGRKDKVVVNEYGEEFTVDDFLEIAEACPIWFQAATWFC